MEKRAEVVLCCVALLCLWSSATGLLSSKGVNYEVQALISIQALLTDPHNVLENWDENAVDPCSWAMITCSPDGFVISLGIPSGNFSGSLSPSISNLTNLQTVLLQNNNISGPIPSELGKLQKLRTLDLSANSFTGQLPSTLSHLKSLQYMRLNNNSLSGPIPSALATMTQLTFLDLSYNNLSGPVPRFQNKTFNVIGNPSICATGRENDCFETTTLLPYFALNNSQSSRPSGTTKSHKIALAFGSSLGCICLLILGFGFLLWWRQRHNKQIFFDVNEQHHEELCLGNLKKFQFRELQIATNNFSSKNLIGKGGFGNVYKGYLHDGTLVAVKRLKDGNAIGGEIQFQTEVEMISLAVHRNLLRLYGFCMTSTERLLVYPYMSNGSVASRLKAKPALDWGTRKRIALGAARGLLYLHEQCDPKIIHRDVKAANILLDDYCEAVVGDFGLAKLLDHRDSHVTTAVRGTVGHIAPEYLSTGQSSEKTDVFGFGILLLELISGLRALEFGKAANQKGAMLDWVRKIHQEKKLDMLVDKDLKNNYDRIELEEMVRVALICTQYLPSHRPKMSEVVRMLEGDGLAEKWEASQRAESTRSRANEFSSSERYSDLTDDSSLLAQAMELSGPRQRLPKLLKLNSSSSSSSQSIRRFRFLLLGTSGPLTLSEKIAHRFPASRTFSSNLVQDSQGPAAIDYSSVLQEDEFHTLANSTIHHFLEKLEEYGDNVEIDGFDVDYGNEVLTLKLGDLGTYVLNKQTPNRQLWLSSPVSGPSRFDWDRNAQTWVYRRTKADLLKILESELEQLCGEPINLS